MDVSSIEGGDKSKSEIRKGLFRPSDSEINEAWRLVAESAFRTALGATPRTANQTQSPRRQLPEAKDK